MFKYPNQFGLKLTVLLSLFFIQIDTKLYYRRSILIASELLMSLLKIGFTPKAKVMIIITHKIKLDPLRYY